MQEHKRVKNGHLLGDVYNWESVKNRIKSFNRSIKYKGKTVQRRRDQQTIDDALEDYPQT